MDPKLVECITNIKHQLPTQIETLKRWCAINSGTDNLLGLERMSSALSMAFKPLADTINTHPFLPFKTLAMTGQLIEQTVAPALLIRKRPQLTKRILLAGHMDTVYHSTHPFQHPKLLNENTLNGPGVADMKGGLLVILHALTAFEQLDSAKNIGWDVLINSDEEIGSPASSLLIEQIATNYQAALVYEPAMDQVGTFAKNRRGSGKFTLIATGKSAHVGRAFHEGYNAIAYLAQVLVAIHALNGQRSGVTINIGKIAGGSALNVVPDLAIAKLDIRITTEKDEAWVYKQLKAILAQLQNKEYPLSLEGSFTRPIKQIDSGTQRLFERIESIGNKLGLSLNWQDSGGCCDGNNIAKHGIPVIDTLGVRGGQIHSEEEFIVLDSLSERTVLSFLLLNDLASGGLSELNR